MKHKRDDYIFDDMKMCKDCYINRKIQVNKFNNFLNRDMADNTFEYIRDGKSYIGSIIGYQHKKGSEDKFYLHMNVNEKTFSIWFDNWMTKKEIAKAVDKWRINIQELLK